MITRTGQLFWDTTVNYIQIIARVGQYLDIPQLTSCIIARTYQLLFIHSCYLQLPILNFMIKCYLKIDHQLYALLAIKCLTHKYFVIIYNGYIMVSSMDSHSQSTTSICSELTKTARQNYYLCEVIKNCFMHLCPWFYPVIWYVTNLYNFNVNCLHHALILCCLNCTWFYAFNRASFSRLH